MSQVCFICSNSLNESETVIVERGITTLINSSVERNDGNVEYLINKQSVKCRKMYTRKISIAAIYSIKQYLQYFTAKRHREMEAGRSTTLSPPRTRMRSGESFFCFKNCCLFCGEDANEEKKTTGI